MTTLPAIQHGRQSTLSLIADMLRELLDLSLGILGFTAFLALVGVGVIVWSAL